MQDDELLYRRLREGDTRAFRTLYERYDRSLFAFIVGYVGRDQGEEIFHEVFVKLLKGPELEISPGAIKAWLYCVARNLSLNTLEKNSNRLRLQRERMENTIPLSCDEALFFQTRTAALNAALRALPSGLLKVYELRRSGLSYEEIAEQLNVPLGTIKSRMHQLTIRLRESLILWREA